MDEIASPNPNSANSSDRLSLANAVITEDVVLISEFLNDREKLVSD
ncbi:hypothetical protein [Nostoc sp.]